MDDQERPAWAGRTQTILEAGDPWEVLPSDLHHFEEHARAYVASNKVDPEAKERVRGVWLEHRHLPPWQKSQKLGSLSGVMPFHRKEIRKTTPTGQAVDIDGVVIEDDAPF